ncbi:MAG: hypothetical protein ACYS32_04875 [Planctomycetota bacterium]|jgi:hypothetical protein
MAMKLKKYWITMTLVLIFCLCCLSQTNALAGKKNTNQKKTVKVSTKYARSRLMRSALKNRAVYKQLQQTVDLSSLTLNTTLSEAIELLRNSTQPPLKIVVMWRDLSDNANIDQDTTIQMDGVSRIKLHTGLDILLIAVSSHFAKLGYIVKDGIIIVATKDSLPVKMSTRVYDVSYLLAAPARFGFRQGFGRGGQAGPNMSRVGRNGQRAGRMAELIRGNIRPDRRR